MRTWTTFNTQYQDLTKNNTTANVTSGGQFINDSIRTICNLQGGKLRFLEATKDILTVANQEKYQTPNGFRKIIDLYITVQPSIDRPTIYMPEMVFDPTKWKLIKAYRLGTSDTPYFTYVENQTVAIQPIPATTGNTITFRGRLNTKSLSIDDYTTGIIVSIANGDTVVTGSGTVWTADMVGRYIQITETTAANGGDGFWYQIGSFTNATTVSLLKPYEGTSIVAGSASYTIGQCSVIPEAYDVAVLYRSVALYWQKQGELTTAKTYWLQYDGGNEAGYSNTYGGIIGEMLATEGETEEGTYVPPFGSGMNLPNAPYYLPYQDASGFN